MKAAAVVIILAFMLNGCQSVKPQLPEKSKTTNKKILKKYPKNQLQLDLAKWRRNRPDRDKFPLPKPYNRYLITNTNHNKLMKKLYK